MNSRLPKRHSRIGSDRRHAAADNTAASLPCLASEWLGDDRLFTPLGHEPGYDYPLLVWLPDSPQRATRKKAFELGKVMQRVSLRNFVAVQPVIGPRESPVAELDERYASGVVARLLEVAATRRISELKGRLTRLAGADPVAEQQALADLMALETYRRSLHAAAHGEQD